MLTRTQAPTHCTGDLLPWDMALETQKEPLPGSCPSRSSQSTEGWGDGSNHRYFSTWSPGHTQRVIGGQKIKNQPCLQEGRDLHRAGNVVGTARKENSMCKGTVA